MAMGLGLRAIFFSGDLPIITQVLTVALLSSFEFMAILHQDPFSVLASMPSYFFYSGVYILMVPIYANSNTQVRMIASAPALRACLDRDAARAGRVLGHARKRVLGRGRAAPAEL